MTAPAFLEVLTPSVKICGSCDQIYIHCLQFKHNRDKLWNNLMADVSGTWLGTYWQQGIPTRFEVTLIQSGNTLTGRILDDSDLGEAQLTGEVVGRRISFIKRYFTTSPDPVTYVGTISEDEDYMQGQWSLKPWGSGPWEARRSGETLMADLQTRIEKKVSLTGV